MIEPGLSRSSRRYALLALAVVVVLACIAIFALFPGVPHSNIDPATAQFTATSSAFAAQFAQGTDSQVEQGAPTAIVNSGVDFKATLVNAINDASSTINLTTYPWQNGGVFSNAVFAAITNAAERGVSVHLLLDAVGSSVSLPKVEALRRAGVDVEYYHELSLLDPFQYDDRDHMRAFVIDGKLGFLGGMGIADDWLGKANAPAWHDLMFEVNGNAAQALNDSFAQLWLDATRQTLAISAATSSPAKANGPEFVNVTSIPQQTPDLIYDAFLMTALSAHRTLYIINPYIVPTPQFLSLVEQKAKEGVDVRIISPGATTTAPLLRLTWHADYAALLAAGVKLYEYQPTMIHTKIMIADGTWSLIGSANLDNRSEVLNAENVMGVQDPSFANQLTTQFMQYENDSVQITAQNWKQQYTLWQKFESAVILLFARQY